MTTQPKLHPLPATEPAPAAAGAGETAAPSRRERFRDSQGMAFVRRVLGHVFLLVPGLLTAYLAFSTGGLYPEDYAAVLGLLALALAGYSLLAREPFAGIGPLALVVVAALVALAVWALASGGWSDAPGVALVEAQRVALYAFAFLMFAAVPRRRGGVATALRGVAFAILAVCVAGLATRLYPDVFTVSNEMARSRLSFPITYWNGLGILSAVGVVLCLHMACHERQLAVWRVLGAAGVPIAAVTLYFTFSRGATAAVAAGVLAYLILARPRGALTGLLAVVPATYIAVRSAYDADLLGTAENTTAAAAEQGHDVAAVLVLACLGAALARLLLCLVDRALEHPLERLRLPAMSLANRVAIAVVAIAVVAAGLFASGAVTELRDSYDRFIDADRNAGDARTRLNDTRLGTRGDHWDVAMDEFRRHRFAGAGAGTYAAIWLEQRPTTAETSEAHSLYFELLAELGVVGLALALVALLTIAAGLLARARHDRRPLYAAIFAATLIWILHAGVDWDWELPAVTLWLFALAGVALARAPGEGRPHPRLSGWPARIGIAVVCLLVAFGAARSVIADAELDTARAAFESGDCRSAVADARSSISAVASRARPFEILAWCESDRGRDARAIELMRHAAELEPRHWRYRYGLAIVRAAAGGDPRPDLQAARERNPLAQIFREGGTADRLAEARPAAWPRLAEQATRPGGQ